MTNENEYSVYQFFKDGSYERVRHFVSANDAVHAADYLSMSVGAQVGTTIRVIITDALDCVCFEWLHGKGVVFPTIESINGNRKKVN
jgi:hypothetical protein